MDSIEQPKKKALKSEYGSKKSLSGVIDMEPKLKEALSFSARLKRANEMRRKEKKMTARRVRSLSMNASFSTLRRRARVEAIKRFKTRLAGGRPIDSLSASEKQRFEKIMQSKGAKNAIARITTKVLPTVRQREKSRHQNKNK